MEIKQKFKPLTKVLDYVFTILLTIVVLVGFYEFVTILYSQIIIGKIEFMSLLGSLFIVLIGLELLKIAIRTKRGTNFYIIAILDIVLVALARKLILLSPKEMLDIYEGVIIGFAMLVILAIIKFMPKEPYIAKKTVKLTGIIKDEVGSLNAITNVLKDYDINISSMNVSPEEKGKSSIFMLLDMSNSLISEKDLKKVLSKLDNVFEINIQRTEAEEI